MLCMKISNILILFMIISCTEIEDSVNQESSSENQESSSVNQESSSGANQSNDSINIPAIGTLFFGYVYADDSNLPACDETYDKKIYYLISSEEFKYCLNNNWTSINLKGDKGDSGQNLQGSTGAEAFRLTHEKISYDASDDAKDSLCINEFGEKFEAANIYEYMIMMPGISGNGHSYLFKGEKYLFSTRDYRQNTSISPDTSRWQKNEFRTGERTDRLWCINTGARLRILSTTYQYFSHTRTHHPQDETLEAACVNEFGENYRPIIKGDIVSVIANDLAWWSRFVSGDNENSIVDVRLGSVLGAGGYLFYRTAFETGNYGGSPGDDFVRNNEHENIVIDGIYSSFSSSGNNAVLDGKFVVGCFKR